MLNVHCQVVVILQELGHWCPLNKDDIKLNIINVINISVFSGHRTDVLNCGLSTGHH